MKNRVICCKPKTLPAIIAQAAAKTACLHNPANAPAAGGLTPQHIAMLTSKYWGAAGVKLGVTFLDTTDAGLKAKILAHMNAWNQWANVTFMESSQGQVRITRAADGYWSYLGTDILHIPAGQATMNLEAFSLSTPDSEYKRVVRHETGHTLGFPHEHMRSEIVARIDPAKAIAYFAANDAWDAATVQAQVLTPLDDAQLQETPADVTSIMCYQLPASIMRDSVAVPGGLDIDPTDGAFAGKVYPLAVTPTGPVGPVGPTGGAKVTLAQIKALNDAEFVKLAGQFARIRNAGAVLQTAEMQLDAAYAALWASA
jgi:hypothetical protein